MAALAEHGEQWKGEAGHGEAGEAYLNLLSSFLGGRTTRSTPLAVRRAIMHGPAGEKTNSIESGNRDIRIRKQSEAGVAHH